MEKKGRGGEGKERREKGKVLLKHLVLVTSGGFPCEYHNAKSLLRYLMWKMRWKTQGLSFLPA